MKCVSPNCSHELGYLTKVENDGCNEILYLNEEFYSKPETMRINQ